VTTNRAQGETTTMSKTDRLIPVFNQISEYGTRRVANPADALDAIAQQAQVQQGYAEDDDARFVALDAIELFCGQVLAAAGANSWDNHESLLERALQELAERRKARQMPVELPAPAQSLPVDEAA